MHISPEDRCLFASYIFSSMMGEIIRPMLLLFCHPVSPHDHMVVYTNSALLSQYCYLFFGLFWCFMHTYEKLPHAVHVKEKPIE